MTVYRKNNIKVTAEHTQRVETAADRQNALEEARREVTDAQLAERVEQKAQLLERRRLEYERVQAERADLNPEILHLEQQRAWAACRSLQEKINTNKHG